jgi:hypothetical protein
MSSGRQREVEEVIPSAARLVSSLRDVGYDFVHAVADLIDNSIAARATRVDVVLRFEGKDSWLRIADDGAGMNAAEITEAMRYGSASEYEADSLGKFGLGLKTASLSQCRRLSVASRCDPERNRVEARQIDLDHVVKHDKWHVFVLGPDDRQSEFVEPLNGNTGTVVFWEKLDRVLRYKVAWGERARSGVYDLTERLGLHLGMVFHRFLAGEVKRRKKLTITLNGAPVEAWDPFVKAERAVIPLPPREFELRAPDATGIVRFQPYVLPPEAKFSTPEAHKRAGGPQKWNAQQGFYIYRANRLVQSGGWSWMRAADEHTKLARAAIDFFPDLDAVFEVNVAKVRVTLPADLREQLRQPVEHLCSQARKVYDAGGGTKPQPPKGGRSAPAPTPPSTRTESGPAGGAGRDLDPPGGRRAADESDRGANEDDAHARRPTRIRTVLESAAATVSETQALARIMGAVTKADGEVASALGW